MQSLYYVHTRTLEYRVCVSWRLPRGVGLGMGVGEKGYTAILPHDWKLTMCMYLWILKNFL